MIKLIAVGALALAAAAPAAAATYVTDTAQFNGLGDQLNSGYDQITLNSVTGSATAPGTYLVNTVDFTVGGNTNNPGYTVTGSFTNNATVDGSPFTYTVPYSITIGQVVDSITIGGNSFTTNGVRVHFNALTLATGGTTTGDLTATVSVPEPATWAMMVAGFGLVGLGVRRRRVAAVAA